MNHVIIGASGYIGSEIYHDLKERNHNVIGSHYKKPIADLSLNLLDHMSVDNFVNNIKFEKIDALYFAHSALEKEVLESCKKGSQFSNLNYDLLANYIAANSTNILRIIQALLPKLQKSNSANIIFLGSLVGKKALNAPLAFSLGKSCLSGLVESLSKELGGMNIKVNSVDPGMLQGGVSRYICAEDKEDYLKHCSLERFGSAKEISNVCTWLGINNTFITGKPFVLDGAL